MRLLLDTHTFLWYVLKDPQLSPTAHSLIADPNNLAEFSPANFCEIAIKVSIKKYSLNEPFQPFMEREISANSFHVLPIEVPHAAVLANLPFHHRDPFDRILISQAIAEHIPIVSADSQLDLYPITRLW